MSSEKSFLALRLCGPIQSWGAESRFNRRNTGLMPSKSAVAGICCAALGYNRGSDEEHEFLNSFSAVKMTAISIPRKNKSGNDHPVRRLTDYHTVQNTLTAEGKIKPSHITYRQYLTDADFGVLLEGRKELMEQMAPALKNPVWGIWLGRKSCIPAMPIYAGLRDSEQEALVLLVGKDATLDEFIHQVEVKDFSEGKDTLLDEPVSFSSENRRFAPRRVLTIQKRKKPYLE